MYSFKKFVCILILCSLSACTEERLDCERNSEAKNCKAKKIKNSQNFDEGNEVLESRNLSNIDLSGTWLGTCLSAESEGLYIASKMNVSFDSVDLSMTVDLSFFSEKTCKSESILAKEEMSFSYELFDDGDLDLIKKMKIITVYADNWLYLISSKYKVDLELNAAKDVTRLSTYTENTPDLFEFQTGDSVLTIYEKRGDNELLLGDAGRYSFFGHDVDLNNRVPQRISEIAEHLIFTKKE